MTHQHDAAGERDRIEAMRQREVQMIGAAISNRNWHSVEDGYNQLRDKLDAYLRDTRSTPKVTGEGVERAFSLSDRVEKHKGSSWCGKVVGFYSTSLTPVGYAVESEREPGSVQIYPEKALRLLASTPTTTRGESAPGVFAYVGAPA